MPKILAVIVTFHSRSDVLLRLLHTLAPQVAGGIIVNNSERGPMPEFMLAPLGFSLQQMSVNVGVASALTAGFDWAKRSGADFVITFDQDSEPAEDMVQRLLDAYHTLCAAGRKVGALGPQQIDSRTAQKAPFLAPISGFRRKVIPAVGQCVEVDHLITSGCLVPMDAWADIGKFLDMLFIDYVDIEWSLRLRQRGWHLYGVGGATLFHAMGDDVHQWGGRQIPAHSPLRHYYMFRNGVYLQKLSHISFGWKLADAFQLMKKLIFFTLVGRPRRAHLRAMLRGIRDGRRGHMGPADEQF